MPEMSTPHNPLWDAHLARIRRAYGTRWTPAMRSRVRATMTATRDRNDAWRSEWDAPAPGRLGRRLLADVEPYLEFFAIALSRP